MSRRFVPPEQISSRCCKLYAQMAALSCSPKGDIDEWLKAETRARMGVVMLAWMGLVAVLICRHLRQRAATTSSGGDSSELGRRLDQPLAYPGVLLLLGVLGRLLLDRAQGRGGRWAVVDVDKAQSLRTM